MPRSKYPMHRETKNPRSFDAGSFGKFRLLDAGGAEDYEISAAIFVPGAFVVPRIGGLVFAVGHGGDAVGSDAGVDEIFASRKRAAFAERTIVIFRAAFVAISFDNKQSARIIF